MKKIIIKIRHLLKCLLDAEYKELSRIREIASYTKFTTRILKYPLIVLDSGAFLFLYEELFKLRTYDFGPKRMNPVILDGGVNIGLSLIFFKSYFPDARIIGFEPDPDIYNICMENLHSFGIHDVIVHNNALFSSEEEISFSKGKNDEGRIDQNNGHSFKVSAVCLSSYMHEKIDFLKLDIEGAESEVIKECAHKLYLVGKLFIEYHSYENEEDTLPELLNIIKAAGFDYYISTPFLINKNPYKSNVTMNGMKFAIHILAINRNHSIVSD